MTTHRRRYEDLTDDDFTPDEAVTVVDSWDDVPRFASEEAAAQWWDSHSLADHLWSTARRGPPLRLVERAAAERARRGLGEKRRPGSPAPAGQYGLSGGQVVAGIVIGGLVVAGAVYLLYELLKGRPAAAGFLPTGSPYLLVSPPRPGVFVRELRSVHSRLS